MNDLRTILEHANVRSTLLVDDAYDDIPRAGDLVRDEDEWTHFFEDIVESDREILRRIYPAFDDTRADTLRDSDAFVGVLWANRSDLRAPLIEPLFARYIRNSTTDRNYLAVLLARLQDAGLTCQTAGRAFGKRAASADVIFMDLFLGSAQHDDDVQPSIQGLAEVIAARRDRPPLVVLMSRSTRLEEKREDFRDSTGLFESMFRIIRKADLADTGTLQRVLMRLATHYNDSLKLSAFLTAWQKGLSNAGLRVFRLIRRLDLADLSQVRQLLLDAEGEPTGSYMVDVFDRVLQHELEGEQAIINAAIALNSLTTDSYPPPYVAGSRDLQSFVNRSLFQNRERLRLGGTEGCPVAFGDVLRRRTVAGGAEHPETSRVIPLPGIDTEMVLTVMTPACDLQRAAAARILLLVGSLRPLEPRNWIYKEQPTQTSVFESQDGQRYWIKWNLKHIETLSFAEFDRALKSGEGFELIARLRESHALELQQKLLSSLGRVGLTAPIPATFPLQVEVYLPNLQRRLTRLDIPALTGNVGVCYVGRGEPPMRLVLNEDACDAICQSVDTANLAQVHPDAHEAINYLRGSAELLHALERGVALPGPDSEEFKDVPSPSSAMAVDGTATTPRIVGLVTRMTELEKPALSRSQGRKAGIILAVRRSEE